MRFSRKHLTIVSDENGKTVTWVSPDLEGFRDAILELTEEAIRSEPSTHIIKENRHRSVYKTRLPVLESPVLVKSFHAPKFTRVLKGLFASYGVRELAHALAAAERGIPIASPLFLLERRKGFKVSECLLGYRYIEGISLYDYLEKEKNIPPERRQHLMWNAGEITALLHARGGVHSDYHAGNLLVLEDASMVLVDLYPLTFRKELSEKDRVEGLAHLVASLAPFVGEEGIDELLKGYRETTHNALPDGLKDKIWRRQGELRRRHEASRAKRCMKDSSQFYQFQGKGLRIAARRELTPERILSILGAFDRKYRTQPADALKNAPESVILKMDDAWSVPLCVKWYRKRGGLDPLKEYLRGGRVLRAWKGGNALVARGIPVAIPYAMVRTRRGGFLFMEAVQGVELDRKLDRLISGATRGDVRLQREVVQAVGELLGRLHRKGIFHADMKACNLMLVEKDGRLEVKLLDYDHVKVYKSLPEKLILKNLVQLNTSVPKEISRSMRCRFLRGYREAFPKAPSAKALFRKVWETSRSMPIVYVTDRGDRIASWQF